MYGVHTVGDRPSGKIGEEDSMFLMGNLNIRLGRLTGSLIANIRSNIR